jgi:hypothetical protein
MRTELFGYNPVEAWKKGVRVLIDNPEQSARDVFAVPGAFLNSAGQVVGQTTGGILNSLAKSTPEAQKAAKGILVPVLIVAALGIAAYFASPYLIRQIKKAGKS